MDKFDRLDFHDSEIDSISFDAAGFLLRIVEVQDLKTKNLVDVGIKFHQPYKLYNNDREVDQIELVSSMNNIISISREISKFKIFIQWDMGKSYEYSDIAIECDNIELLIDA
ncbi:hypothetical protein [Microvirga sp. CF3016]|uniref:hypothetical protein n=1 Tax=Microvirga sp. CF3016 TaxID=3110181 RepID=UPI002E767B7B|nr:hypothetical protein [Microvirga sp. CF3016]MEE1611407.1 hypothetical protein [Microvirga sp. CF3016]